MRKKKLLAVTLCVALAMSVAVPGTAQGDNNQKTAAEANAAAGTKASEDEAAKAKAAESEAKAKAESEAAAKAESERQSEAARAESEAAAKAESERQSEAARAESEAAAKAESERQSEAARAESEAAAKAESERQSEAARAESEAAAKAESERQSEAARAESEAAAKAESERQSEAARAESEAAAKAESERQSEAARRESETQTEVPVTEPETQTEAPATEPGTQTETPVTESETQTDPPATESETQTETPAESETQTETPTESETQTEAPVTESETQEQTESESESETESEMESESESETEFESETEEELTNEELIARQNIVIPPEIEMEFRFTQIEKEYAIVKEREGCSVYEEKSESSREVGKLSYYGICYIIADGGQDWIYIESGEVRGFVESDRLATGDVALRVVHVKGEDELPEATVLVAKSENAAFTYTKTTVQEVMADKNYAVAARELEIHEQKSDSSRTVGKLARDGLCYILEHTDSTWVYVESGNARGFVRISELTTGQAAGNVVRDRGENNLALADVLIEPEDNKSCYYTLTSVKKASQSALTRESMVNFAMQFLGNPYVWGGTSLTGGADCSGFVQSIYANYGYSLPRVACDQAVYGTQIPIESALPGDLIFYARNGYVYHVSMYIGNGQVIHAAGKNYGIITSGIGGNAVWATRVIQD